MTSPRERQLAEGLKNRLIGIQKSKQIYDRLARLGRKALKRNEQELERISKSIAAEVEKYIVQNENRGKPPTFEEILKKIKEELEKLRNEERKR